MLLAAVIWAVASSGAESPSELAYGEIEVTLVEPEIGEPQAFTASSGSALASAAPSACPPLQPETYNSEIVIDIIKASPLTDRTRNHALPVGWKP